MMTQPVTKFDTLADALANYDLSLDEFDDLLERGIVQDLTLNTYNGASDLSTPIELTDENIEQTLYHEAQNDHQFDDLTERLYAPNSQNAKNRQSYMADQFAESANTLFVVKDTRHIYYSTETI